MLPTFMSVTFIKNVNLRKIQLVRITYKFKLKEIERTWKDRSEEMKLYLKRTAEIEKFWTKWTISEKKHISRSISVWEGKTI